MKNLVKTIVFYTNIHLSNIKYVFLTNMYLFFNINTMELLIIITVLVVLLCGIMVLTQKNGGGKEYPNISESVKVKGNGESVYTNSAKEQYPKTSESVKVKGNGESANTNSAKDNITVTTGTNHSDKATRMDYKVVADCFLSAEPKINERKQLYVDYSLLNSTEMKYPVLRFPVKGCPIKYPLVGRKGKRGFCEQKLCNEIIDLGLQDKFYDKLCLFIGGYNHPFEPDLVYINNNIFIDIEVDEPYAGCSREPIHYYNYLNNSFVDECRNNFFTERGWTVIRFTEKQVFLQMKPCIKKIFQILHLMDSSIQIPSKLINVPDLIEEYAWTLEQARGMCMRKEREKYLNINRFIDCETVSNIVLDESIYGRNYEDALIKRKDDCFWQMCKDSRVDSYLKRYPNGKHVQEANQIKDDQLWEKCKNTEDYKKYLREGVSTSHKLEAERLIKVQEEQLAQQNRINDHMRQQEALHQEHRAITTRTTPRPTPSSRGYA